MEDHRRKQWMKHSPELTYFKSTRDKLKKWKKENENQNGEKWGNLSKDIPKGKLRKMESGEQERNRKILKYILIMIESIMLSS